MSRYRLEFVAKQRLPSINLSVLLLRRDLGLKQCCVSLIQRTVADTA